MKYEMVCFFAMIWSVTTHAQDTELTLYQPASMITAKKNGDCLQQSKLIQREDAWHCIAEGKTYDPCFVQVYGSHLDAICPASPWSNKATQITVTKPLDNKRHHTLDMSRTFPWAVELSKGMKCEAIETTVQYDGLPVHYRCENGAELIGHVQRCDSVWKMLQHDANGVETVEIKRAWF